jgi:hypothetical protein
MALAGDSTEGEIRKKEGERGFPLSPVRELAPLLLPGAPVPQVDSTAPICWARPNFLTI